MNKTAECISFINELEVDLPADLERSPARHAWRLLRCGGMFIARICDRHVHRHRLAQLDDRQLADIGRSRKEALAEASRPIWRA